MKHCTKCGEDKPKADFSRHTKHKDGLQKECKTCNAVRSREHYAAHKERIDAKHAAYRAENLEKENARSARWYAENRDRHYGNHKKWIEGNREKHNGYRRNWAKCNPDKNAARAAMCRAEKLRATPEWADSFFIEEIYDLAQRRSRVLGVEYHVDHIVPLKSKLVCGLHVPANLRVIPKKENMRKSNKYWPDMPIAA